MDDETEREFRKMLSKAVRLAEENNRILTKLRRAQFWGRIFTVFYWLVILGIAVGAYYFVQPYIQPVIDTLQGVLPGIENATELLQGADLQDSQNQ